MTEETRTQGEDRPAVGMLTMELVVAALLFAIGAAVAISSFKLGARWADDGPQSGYFPFYIGIILCICSLVTFVQGLSGKLGANRSFVDRGPLRQVMSVLVPAAGYVLLIQLIGIYVAAAVYITFFMIWLGRYSWLKGDSLGIGVSAFAFVLVEVWFQVPLYKGGWFDPLSFLGY
jgi:hypothetical protein